MNPSAMREALEKRKGRSLDITILLGDPDKADAMNPEETPEEERKESGLAPEATVLEASPEDKAQDQMLLEKTMEHSPMGRSSLFEKARMMHQKKSKK